MSLSVEPLRAVLFDLDGTLIPDGLRRATPDQLRRATRIDVDVDVTHALTRIAARLRIGIVSDGSSIRQRAKLAATGLLPLFSVVVISGEVRAQKPSAKIFEHAIRALGTSPSGILFVGNDPRRDLAGARRVGLQTCWVSHGATLARDAGSPDLVVESVAALAEVLTC